MMRGGVVVELEIAMPQSRYVAQFSKRSSSPIPIPAIAIFDRILSRNLMFFCSQAGFPLQPTKTVRVAPKRVQRRNCA
jgi:hypothetical protein